jgi:hypothetical protein
MRHAANDARSSCSLSVARRGDLPSTASQMSPYSCKFSIDLRSITFRIAFANARNRQG